MVSSPPLAVCRTAVPHVWELDKIIKCEARSILRMICCGSSGWEFHSVEDWLLNIKLESNFAKLEYVIKRKKLVDMVNVENNFVAMDF